MTISKVCFTGVKNSKIKKLKKFVDENFAYFDENDVVVKRINDKHSKVKFIIKHWHHTDEAYKSRYLTRKGKIIKIFYDVENVEKDMSRNKNYWWCKIINQHKTPYDDENPDTIDVLGFEVYDPFVSTKK